MQADGAIEMSQGLTRAARRGEIVTGLKDVRGIETNAEPLRRADGSDDLRELLESVTERGALARSGLERDFGFRLWQDGVDRIDGSDNAIEPGFVAGAEVRAGMQNEERKLELVSAG